LADLRLDQEGVAVFGSDPAVLKWARAARDIAQRIAEDPSEQARHLRHGKTWFSGVDVLPNEPDGSVAGVPLVGPWQEFVPDLRQHAGQLSIVYPGYPKRDPDQSEANHRYRMDRMAAHVDGLLPIGPERRRFAREYHAYVLGLPLNHVASAPTVVWQGSHVIMQRALVQAIADRSVADVDVTDAYHAARREVFERCTPVPIIAAPGQSFLIHRFALHGTGPWQGPVGPGRMIAFFRPEYDDPRKWLLD
jgi:hypothetical protein